MISPTISTRSGTSRPWLKRKEAEEEWAAHAAVDAEMEQRRVAAAREAAKKQTRERRNDGAGPSGSK
jgi:hypothetical protein